MILKTQQTLDLQLAQVRLVVTAVLIVHLCLAFLDERLHTIIVTVAVGVQGAPQLSINILPLILVAVGPIFQLDQTNQYHPVAVQAPFTELRRRDPQIYPLPP